MQFCKVVLFALLISASAVFAQEADLAVEKLGPSEAAEDSDVAYTVTVTNAGPGAALSVVLADPVPANMSFVSAMQETGPTFACDATINCTIASLAAGETATFTFTFHLDEPGDFTNTATVSSQTFDPNDENNTSSTSTTTGSTQADLAVSKDATATAAAPDSDVTFVITLTNAGPADAVDVLLTDNLPAPLTFVSFTQTSGPAMSCGTSTCSVASFPAGAAATFELVGHVPAGTPSGTEVTNTATVESANDPAEENNSGTTTVIVATADVRIVKTGPATADAGTTIAYQLTVTNDGPDVALGVLVVDPQVCDSVNCQLGNIAPGASVVIDANVTIPPDATGTWTNTAEVTTGSFDPDTSDNSSTVETAITQSADVSVVKTAPATVEASNNLTYTITVTNDGPSDASNVVLTDTLPAGTTFVSSSCGANPCNLGTLDPDEVVVVTLVVHVTATTTGTISNTAVVSSSTPDPSSGNNTSQFDTDVVPAPADLAIVKTGDAAAIVNSNVTYTIVVTNNGPGPAANVVVTDAVPAGTTLVASAGCTGTTTVTCTVGTLAAGDSATIELVLTMPATPQTVTNTAQVETSSNDPVSANDTSSAQTVVALEPVDVTIAKTADREFALIGSNVTYTIVVTNNGPGTALNVEVIDDLPAGTTLVSASAGCTGTTTVTCTVGTMAPDTSATIELVVTMPSTPGPVTNVARVETTSDDVTPANDASTAVVNAQASAPAVPALSPAALAFLAITLATVVLVVLRRAS